MDKIIISGAQFIVHSGVSDDERKQKQSIVVDCELYYDIKKSGLTDAIDNTINYSEVHAVLKNFIELKQWHLIEALAEQSAAKIIEHFPVRGIKITVKKSGALASKNVDYCAVEIMRMR